MKKILIAYDTVSDSTRHAASIIYTELKQLEGTSADLKHYNDVSGLNNYDVVIIGSPMRFKNFNSNIRNFIARNKETLRHKRTIFFLTCLYLIEDTEHTLHGPPVFIDPSFEAAPKPVSEMNMMDKTHSDSQYIHTLLKSPVSPVAMGFFKGRLDLGSLNFFSRLFMKIVVSVTKKEQVGDFLNPSSVSEWANSLKKVVTTA